MFGKRKGVRFLCPYTCDSWDLREAPDSTGETRTAIVFHLFPMNVNRQQSLSVAQVLDQSGDDFDELRRRAYLDGNSAPQRSEKDAKRSYVQRSRAVRDYALARAAGVCELCERPAPFQTSACAPFLEVHHIRRLDRKSVV